MRIALVTFFALILFGCGEKVGTSEQEAMYKMRLEAIGGAYQSGRHGLAIDQMQLFLQDFPQSAEGWTILGHAYRGKLQPAAAKEAYLQAIKIDADQYQAMSSLGSIFLVERDYDQAMNYFREAVTVNPEFAQAWSSMIIVALKQYKDDLALECAEKALLLASTDPTVAANAAVAYHVNNNFEMRDQLTLKARELGIPDNDLYTLDRIYGGEISIRGTLPVGAEETQPAEPNLKEN